MRVAKSIVMIVVCSSVSLAQYYSEILVMEVVDSRSLGLGGVGVGLRSANSMYHNPAILATIEGIEVSYTNRPMDWIESLDGQYYSFTATADLGFVGTLGVQFHRFNSGEAIVTGSDPTPIERVFPFEQYWSVGYARQVTSSLTAGLSVKFYQNKVPSFFAPYNARATVFDLGCTYSFSFFDGQNLSDVLTLGTSLQNFGTDVRITEGSFSYSGKLPRLFRLGASYGLTVLERSEELSPLRIMLAADYMNDLIHPSNGNRDYYSVGTEVTLYEVVSIRTGSSVRPYSSIYGVRNQGAWVYGAGLALPVWLIVKDLYALSIHFDYTIMPISGQGFGARKDKFSIFGIRLSWNDKIL